MPKFWGGVAETPRMSKAGVGLIAGLLVFGAVPLLLYRMLRTEPPPVRQVEVVASYVVEGDGIVLAEGIRQPWHAEVWERWVELVPADRRRPVTHFEAIVGVNDGEVYPNDTSLRTWTLALADNDDRRVVDATILHELGHLVTISPGQLRPADGPRVEATCRTYFTGEGCALPSSVINGFVEAFWSERELASVGTVTTAERYRANRDGYVTEYAATNPSEDLAETFVDFMYYPKPLGTSLADRKVSFLWEYPVLVQLRTEIHPQL